MTLPQAVEERVPQLGGLRPRAQGAPEERELRSGVVPFPVRVAQELQEEERAALLSGASQGARHVEEEVEVARRALEVRHPAIVDLVEPPCVEEGANLGVEVHVSTPR